MGLTAYYTDRARSASLQATLPCKVTKSNVRNSLIPAFLLLHAGSFMPEADVANSWLC